MDKATVLARLCILMTKVAAEQFGAGTVAHDCFCGENPLSSHPLVSYSMDRRVVEFVEEAVFEALTKPVKHNDDNPCTNCCSSRGCNCAVNGLAPR